MHCLEWKTNVGALARRKAVRNQIETLQTQNMIQPNGPRVAHGCLQHVAKWFELLILQTGRVESGQTPILPRGVENIRRRTNCHPRQYRILIAPSVEAVAANPDRNIEIEPER